MSIKSDSWIRRMAEQHAMIEPFEPQQVKQIDGRRVVSYRVNLESVTIGDVTLFNVEGVVQGGGEPLLGMSFLSRTEMRNDGQNLVLTKRY